MFFVPLEIWALTKFNSWMTSGRVILYHQEQRLQLSPAFGRKRLLPNSKRGKHLKATSDEKTKPKNPKLSASGTTTSSISTFCIYFSFSCCQSPEYQEKTYQRGRILNISGGSRSSKLIQDKDSANNKTCF